MINYEQQWRQEEHDRLFHGDIYHLNRYDRLNHLTLHLVKYHGKWMLAKDPAEKVKLCIDAVIVCTSILNSLGIIYDDKIHDLDLSISYDRFVGIGVFIGEMADALIQHRDMESGDIRKVFTNSALRLLGHWGAEAVDQSAKMSPEEHSAWGYNQAILERLIFIEKKHPFYEDIIHNNPQVRP